MTLSHLFRFRLSFISLNCFNFLNWTLIIFQVYSLHRSWCPQYIMSFGFFLAALKNLRRSSFQARVDRWWILRLRRITLLACISTLKLNCWSLWLSWCFFHEQSSTFFEVRLYQCLVLYQRFSLRGLVLVSMNLNLTSLPALSIIAAHRSIH